MSMREKCARALYEKATERESGISPLGIIRDIPTWDELGEDVKGFALEEVDAVLDALMEPTNDMLEAMFVSMFDAKFTGAELPMMGAGFEAAVKAAKDGK